jgi:hypothetical protein
LIPHLPFNELFGQDKSKSHELSPETNEGYQSLVQSNPCQLTLITTSFKSDMLLLLSLDCLKTEKLPISKATYVRTFVTINPNKMEASATP